MEFSKLFTPGPTAVPRRVQNVLGQPLIHHRTESFRNALRNVTEGLQYVIGTRNPVIILTASGSGAMEAALANITKPGEKVLITSSGKFGERWGELATAYGLATVIVEAKWGRPVIPEQVEAAMGEESDVKAVFTTHSETSTGVLQDIAGIADVARTYGAIVVVDAISSLCAHEMKADSWGLDVVIGGAQKGFGIPPGLSFLSLSENSIGRIREKGHPRYYFDLSKALDALEKGDTPYTPAISLVMAMQESLSMIREEGLENVIRRHARNASAVREAVRELELELFASSPCNATTAVIPKKGKAGDIVRTMETRYGVKIAGGQAHLSGKIFRLGHLGFQDETDIYAMISALEGALTELGLNPTPGKGLEAAMRSFQASHKK